MTDEVEVKEPEVVPDMYLFSPKNDINLHELVEILQLLAISIAGPVFNDAPLSKEARRHFVGKTFNRIKTVNN